MPARTRGGILQYLASLFRAVISMRRDEARVDAWQMFNQSQRGCFLDRTRNSGDKKGQACDGLEQPRGGTETREACIVTVLEFDRLALNEMESGANGRALEVALARPTYAVGDGRCSAHVLLRF